MELPSDIQGFGDPRLLKFHNNFGLHVLGFVPYFLVNLIIRWGPISCHSKQLNRRRRVSGRFPAQEVAA